MESYVAALHEAVKTDRLDLVLSMLKCGAYPEEKDGRGWTPLHTAASLGKPEMVITLLNAKSNIEATTPQRRYTVLHIVAEAGHADVVELLLRRGADIMAVTAKGRTALHLAADACHHDTVSSLLNWGADVHATTTESGWMALHTAAERGSNSIILLLLRKGADIGAVTKKGWNALHIAADVCHHDTVLSLLDWGADVHATTTESGQMALHKAAERGSVSVTLLLLRKGADIGAVTKNGWNALHFAADACHHDTVLSLLDWGADVHATTAGSGQMALHKAAERGSVSITLLLLRKGVDIGVVTKKGWNALHFAAHAGYEQVVQTLLDQKADVYSAIESTGYTALHLAAKKAHDVVLTVLLKGGAYPLARTRNGLTALDITLESDTPTRTILQKAMEKASQAKHMQEVSALQSIQECPPPSSYEIRPSPPGYNDEVIPRELSNFIPEIAKRRIRNLWASPRQRPSALYDIKKFLERMDDLLSQDAFQQLIQQARDAPLNSSGDKTFLYFGSVKFIYNNVTVTVQTGIDLLRDDNFISKNLLSLLGNPRKSSDRLYELSISALPLEPVLDPAHGFVEFPQAEVFKLDPKAKHDAVLGYDFFNFQGKDLLLSAQRWHVLYEEFAMARLQAEASKRLGLQEDKFHFVESIRICRPRNPRPYVKIRATFHTGRERSLVSRDIVRQLGCSGDEPEIPLAFHFISEDNEYVWVFDVVEKLGAELVVGLDWLSSAGQSILTRRQTSTPIIEPVPTSGKAILDNQATDLSLTTRVRRPASTSPHMANPEFQVDERETSDHRRTSDLAVPDPHYRPQSAPAQEKGQNTQMQEIELRCGNTPIVAVALLDSACTDDWVSYRFIRRLESNAIGQDPIAVNFPTGVAVPTFTDFNGNDKQPSGTIMASWKMTHLNPHLMYDSTFYINDSPNAPFDVLLGRRTLFENGIYNLSHNMHGSLPLIHKPISLLQSRHIAQGEARTKAEIDRQDAWRRQQEEEEEEERRRTQARARAR